MLTLRCPIEKVTLRRQKFILKNSQKLLNFVSIRYQKNTFYGPSKALSQSARHPRVTHWWLAFLDNILNAALRAEKQAQQPRTADRAPGS